MTCYTATIRWRHDGNDFGRGKYSRAHTWTFDGGVEVPASASPHVVPAPMSDAHGVEPEEAFVAAISSCHMLTFLHVARLAGFAIAAYADDAVGTMTKNEHGKSWVSKVVLTPRIASGTSLLVASMKVNAGAIINLTAPATGTFKGVLIYQDRRATTMGEEININGNSTSRLEGAIYTPRNQMRFNGNSSMNINCLQMAAYRFVFTGNSSITNVCPANSGSGAFVGTLVKLMA